MSNLELISRSIDHHIAILGGFISGGGAKLKDLDEAVRFIDLYREGVNEQMEQNLLKINEQKAAIDQLSKCIDAKNDEISMKLGHIQVLSARIQAIDTNNRSVGIPHETQGLIAQLRRDCESLREENSVLLKEKEVNSAANPAFPSKSNPDLAELIDKLTKRNRELEIGIQKSIEAREEWRKDATECDKRTGDALGQVAELQAELNDVILYAAKLEMESDDCGDDSSDQSRFRFLHLHAQLNSVNEREREINRLVKVTCISHGEAGRIYDAGYRKHDQS